jgi:hypothetical protein
MSKTRHLTRKNPWRKELYFITQKTLLKDEYIFRLQTEIILNSCAKKASLKLNSSMVLNPRASSPKDFSTHALEVLT